MRIKRVVCSPKPRVYSEDQPKLPSQSLLLYGQNVESGHLHHQFSLLGRKFDTLSRLELPAFVLDESFEKIYIVGPGNGLVCLHLLGDGIQTELIVVWNPVTKQHKKLPKPLSFEEEKKMFEPLVGFGFIRDHGINSTDYKVARISRSKGQGRLGYVTQVFTRNANSWRVVKDRNASGYLFYQPSSITLNEMLYSLAWNRMGWIVFSFNPHDGYFITYSYRSLIYVLAETRSVWNNLVAYSTWTYHIPQYDVWVMTTESRDNTQMPANWNWTKQVTIKPLIMDGIMDIPVEFGMINLFLTKSSTRIQIPVYV